MSKNNFAVRSQQSGLTWRGVLPSRRVSGGHVQVAMLQGSICMMGSQVCSLHNYSSCHLLRITFLKTQLVLLQ